MDNFAKLMNNIVVTAKPNKEVITPIENISEMIKAILYHHITDMETGKPFIFNEREEVYLFFDMVEIIIKEYKDRLEKVADNPGTTIMIDDMIKTTKEVISKKYFK